MCYREQSGMTHEAMNWLIARLQEIEATAATDRDKALAQVSALRAGVEQARDRNL